MLKVRIVLSIFFILAKHQQLPLIFFEISACLEVGKTSNFVKIICSIAKVSTKVLYKKLDINKYLLHLHILNGQRKKRDFLALETAIYHWEGIDGISTQLKCNTYNVRQSHFPLQKYMTVHSYPKILIEVLHVKFPRHQI